MIYVCTQQILPESDKYEIISPQAVTHAQAFKEGWLDNETKGFDPIQKNPIMLQLGCYEFPSSVRYNYCKPKFLKTILNLIDYLLVGISSLT